MHCHATQVHLSSAGSDPIFGRLRDAFRSGAAQTVGAVAAESRAEDTAAATDAGSTAATKVAHARQYQEGTAGVPVNLVWQSMATMFGVSSGGALRTQRALAFADVSIELLVLGAGNEPPRQLVEATGAWARRAWWPVDIWQLPKRELRAPPHALEASRKDL